MSEVPVIKLPEVKDSLKIGKINATHEEVRNTRRPISVCLPLYLFGSTPPRPDPGDPLTNLGGVSKRFGFKPPPLNRKKARKFARFVDLWLRHNVKPLGPESMLTFWEWLEGTSYTEGRKAELARTWENCDQKVDIKKWLKVKSFIKDETYPEYKYPRAINSRIDEAKCFFGPIVQSISNVIFKNPYFIKKIPVPLRAEYIRDTLQKDGAEYDFTDATSFEASFVPEVMLVCEYRMYRFFCRGLDCWVELKLFLLMVKMGNNILIFKYFTVTIVATRMSGEMDTSLANGFFNLMAYLFLSWEKGADLRDIPGFVEGDDGLFRNKPQWSPTLEDYAELGVVIKIGKTKNLSEASFCGQVYDMEELVVVTDPVEVIARFGWTNKKYTQANDRTLLQLLRSKGYSLVYQYAGCPMLDALGRRILDLTTGVQIEERILNNMDQWEQEKLRAAINNIPAEKPIGNGTRTLVEKLYNVSIHEQKEFEKYCKTLTLYKPIEWDLPIPPVWNEYYERYHNNETRDDHPHWLLRSEYKYIKTLLTIPNNVKAVERYLRT